MSSRYFVLRVYCLQGILSPSYNFLLEYCLVFRVYWSQGLFFLRVYCFQVLGFLWFIVFKVYSTQSLCFCSHGLLFSVFIVFRIYLSLGLLLSVFIALRFCFPQSLLPSRFIVSRVPHSLLSLVYILPGVFCPQGFLSWVWSESCYKQGPTSSMVVKMTYIVCNAFILLIEWLLMATFRRNMDRAKSPTISDQHKKRCSSFFLLQALSCMHSSNNTNTQWLPM